MQNNHNPPILTLSDLVVNKQTRDVALGIFKM